MVLICYVIKEFLNNQNIFESLLIMICCYGYCTKLNVMKYNQQIPVWGRKYQFHKFFFINRDWSSGESFVFVRINLCVCNRRANKVQYEAHCIWQYVNMIVFFLMAYLIENFNFTYDYIFLQINICIYTSVIRDFQFDNNDKMHPINTFNLAFTLQCCKNH